MTLPRTAAQVLSGHVRLEIRCIDRMLLTFRQPRLQYGQGIHGFFCHHRGNQFVSSALMRPMTGRFAADIGHYIDVRGLDLVRFAKGQSKDQIARSYLAGHDGGEQILFAGVAQEKTRIWRTRQRTDAVTGKRYPWLCQEQAMVNHWYFYGFDADFGPFYVKFCGYFPYTGQIYLNGHEYAKRQCLKDGIGFTALDNAFGAVTDPAAVQRICDGLTDQKIYRFAGKWLARLPHPFTRDDEDADYRWQLSVQQIEFSTTMALDRPVAGRIFFEQLIRDNIDIGRPDKVNIVFGRTIRRRGKNPAPGTFRTQVITSGVCPYLYLFYKKTQVKQYLKEGRALRTETTLNQPRKAHTFEPTCARWRLKFTGWRAGCLGPGQPRRAGRRRGPCRGPRRRAWDPGWRRDRQAGSPAGSGFRCRPDPAPGPGTGPTPRCAGSWCEW